MTDVFLINELKYPMKKGAVISFSKSEFTIENPNHYSICFPKVRGETFARDIYK